MKKINNKLQLPNSKTAVRWIKNILPVSFIPFTVNWLNAKTVYSNSMDTVSLPPRDTTALAGCLDALQGCSSGVSLTAMVFYSLIGSLVAFFVLRIIQHLYSQSKKKK